MTELSANDYPWFSCEVCGDLTNAEGCYAVDFFVCNRCAKSIAQEYPDKFLQPERGDCFVCNGIRGSAKLDEPIGRWFGICKECARYIVQCFTTNYGIIPTGPVNPRPRKPITAKVRWQIFARDNFTCQKCGETGVELTVDHKIALAKGGADDESNYWTLCRSCNCTKGVH